MYTIYISGLYIRPHCSRMKGAGTYVFEETGIMLSVGHITFPYLSKVEYDLCDFKSQKGSEHFKNMIKRDIVMQKCR
jgi:hypothetical protein